MGRYLERNIRDAVATYYPNEGHHFVYERWREILGVLLAEARGHAPSAAPQDGVMEADHDAAAGARRVSTSRARAGR